jgi:hypothetical protein
MSIFRNLLSPHLPNSLSDEYSSLLFCAVSFGCLRLAIHPSHFTNNYSGVFQLPARTIAGDAHNFEASKNVAWVVSID